MKLFLRYKVISKIEGMGPDPRVTPWDIKVVIFNPSHYQGLDYIWFTGGDLYGFYIYGHK